MIAHHRSILFAALVLGFVWTASAADIHVPGQYEDLQAAINAAEDGDRILIEPQSWHRDGYLIDGKSITLETASGEEMAIISGGGFSAALHVVGGSNVTLSGLELRGTTHPIDYRGGEVGLRCSSAEVTAIDCEISGGEGLGFDGGFYIETVPGVFLLDGAVATFVDCTVDGAHGFKSNRLPTNGYPGGPGIFCRDAGQLRLTGCVVTGGDGSSGVSWPEMNWPVTSGKGGAGIDAEQIERMNISICQSVVHGGAGGNDNSGGTNEPGGVGFTTSGHCSITSMGAGYWGIRIGCGGVWHIDTDQQVDALLGIAPLASPLGGVADANCDDEFNMADVLYRMEWLDSDDFEPDDLSESAATIASGETHCFRNIVPVGDQDWTRFTLDQTATVTANAKSSFPELELSLFRFDDETPVILASDTSTQAVVSAELIAGDYYLRVGDSGGDGTVVNYSLSLGVAPQ